MTPAPGLDKRAPDRSLLIVEDDDDIREALVVSLSREGFRVTGCSNGREALDLLRDNGKPDLIVLDLMMPVMDGWQFRVMQKEDPELSSIPVIALSADVTAKGAAIDVDAYLAKPADYQTLVDTIERLLVLRQHREMQARLAQTDRLTSLGTLAAGVAHQINNPLAYVLLNLDFVGDELGVLLPDLSGERGHELRVALSQAREGASRIGDIVRGLKTFSRPDNDAMVSLDVTSVLEATLAMVANELRHGARLVKDFTPVADVVANEARLGQVFLNLLLNALQALPPERREGNEIRVVVRAPAIDRVVVEVHDNGVGIAPQVLGRIFEPFFTTKPVGMGTGLGLAICHGIVTSFGGTLSVESRPGKGSVFRVELPAAGHAPGVSTRGSSPPPSKVPPPQRSILIVDDEPAVGLTLKRLLAGEGRVVALTSAKQALARIMSGERFDLLLCDVMMPGMDAPVLYDELSKVAPEQAERMVFMSGGAFTPRAHEFLQRVPNARLDKPFDIGALLALVRARMA